MNAAAQRRLTPWLLGIVLLTGALLLAFWLGLGGGIRWNPPHPAAALPPAHIAAAPPPPPLLASYAAVWQHPLFSADRKPAPSAGSKASAGLGDLQLSGVILTPGLRMALLRDKDGNRAVRVRVGEALPDSGLTLLELKSRSAVFGSAGGRNELELPVTTPDPLKNERDGAQVNNGLPPSMQAPNEAPTAQPQSGAAMMQVLSPSGAPTRSPPPHNSDAAALQSRIEALKAAVQRRRAAQQQAAPTNDVPTRDR